MRARPQQPVNALARLLPLVRRFLQWPVLVLLFFACALSLVIYSPVNRDTLWVSRDDPFHLTAKDEVFMLPPKMTFDGQKASLPQPNPIQPRAKPLEQLIKENLVPTFNFTPKRIETRLGALYKYPDTPLKQLCVVIRTYEKQYRNMATLLLNLGQDPVPTHVFVTVTEPANSHEPLIKIVEKLHAVVGRTFVHILPITKEQADSVWVQPNGAPHYGYTYTDFAIDMMVAGNAPCDYLLVTNGDNLYAPNFAYRYLLPHMLQDMDIIGFRYLDHGPHSWLVDTNPDAGGGVISDEGAMKPWVFNWIIGHCDLGAAIIKWKWFRDFDLRFVKDSRMGGGGAKDLYSSDGQIIDLVARLSGDKKKRVRQFVFMHQ